VIEEVADSTSGLNQALQSISCRWRPSNLSTYLMSSSPIIDAKVCHLVKSNSDPMSSGLRFQKNEKPIYLKAEVKNHHLLKSVFTPLVKVC
jgi:hypothetical protein